MRRWLLLLLGTAWLSRSMAQQEVSLQAPFAGIIQGTQLWNVVMVNATTSPLLVRVNVTVTRTTDNQVMETVSSAILTLAAGAHQMSASDFGPYVVSYLSPGFPDITNSSSLLPANYYQVCYNVDKVIGDASRPAAEQCNEVEVQPLSPPQLVYPADSSAIPNPYPQFSWSPPAPITMLPNLHYDLKVVELQAGQSYAQAIQSNIPVFSQGQLTQANLGYPAAATSLQSGKSYLWQVTAVSGAYSMQSEVWQFYKAEVRDSVTVPSHVYVSLEKSLTPSTFLSSDTLRMRLFNFLTDTTIQYSIKSLQSPNSAPVASGMIPLSRGENYIDFKLPGSVSSGNGLSYVMILTDSRNQKWKVQFVQHP